jgi:hypothetical protein
MVSGKIGRLPDPLFYATFRARPECHCYRCRAESLRQRWRNARATASSVLKLVTYRIAHAGRKDSFTKPGEMSCNHGEGSDTPLSFWRETARTLLSRCDVAAP